MENNRNNNNYYIKHDIQLLVQFTVLHTCRVLQHVKNSIWYCDSPNGIWSIGINVSESSDTHWANLKRRLLFFLDCKFFITWTLKEMNWKRLDFIPSISATLKNTLSNILINSTLPNNGRILSIKSLKAFPPLLPARFEQWWNISSRCGVAFESSLWCWLEKLQNWLEWIQTHSQCTSTIL